MQRRRSCWSTRSCVLSLCLFTSLLVPSYAQVVNNDTIRVTATDSSINYVGVWVVQDGGEYKFAAQAGASASLNFKGSSISWFAAKDPNGGLASVQLDAEPAVTIDVSAGMQPNESVQVAPLFTNVGLDASSNHTIVINYAGGSQGLYITLYYFQYDPKINASASASSSASNPASRSYAQSTIIASSPSSDASIPGSKTSRKLAGDIAGAAVGGAAGSLMIAALVFCFCRQARRRRRAKEQYEKPLPYAGLREESLLSQAAMPNAAKGSPTQDLASSPLIISSLRTQEHAVIGVQSAHDRAIQGRGDHEISMLASGEPEARRRSGNLPDGGVGLSYGADGSRRTSDVRPQGSGTELPPRYHP